jgi:spore coat polysaccharide biosynthesis predicted glycosyltransferase SpsG
VVHDLQAPRAGPADAAETAALALRLGAQWVVADGYHLGSAWQRAVVRAGLRLAFHDDNGHGSPYSAHLVINQNAHASPALHPGRAAHTHLALGCGYALLREEFLRAGPREHADGPVRHVVITLGGSDPDGLCARVARALVDALPEDVRITAVVGAASPHRAAIEALAAACGRLEARFGVRNMAALLRSADLAVSAAGSTTWELCYLGVPSILLLVADNQVGASEAVAAAGAALVLGWGVQLSPAEIGTAAAALCRDRDARARLHHAARALVDGGGPDRLFDLLTTRTDP